jgi:hypothetical protein
MVPQPLLPEPRATAYHEHWLPLLDDISFVVALAGCDAAALKGIGIRAACELASSTMVGGLAVVLRGCLTRPQHAEVRFQGWLEPPGCFDP